MTSASSTDDIDAANAGMQRVITAAWLAVIAGVGAQLVVIGVRAWAGGAIQAAGFYAEMAQAVSWSVLVCAAIAIGALASKARVHIAGLLGFLAGPLAWAAAKGVQKGVQALAGAPQDQLTPIFWTVCLWKGFEYALLGAGLAMIVQRRSAPLSSYLTFGALVGALGAAIVIALNIANAMLTGGDVPLAKIASLGANELCFTTACAVVIYTAQALTRHLSVLKAV